MVATRAPSLDELAPGSEAQGFVVQAIYVDDDDRPRGARLLHRRSHFLFDYLQIESAPQAMVYVGTYPTSDDGEPHTQEHLLLGKGNKGRFLGNLEHVMLAESSAFTAQYRTVYDFYTVAGVEAFWPLFRTEIDSILHPDYTDDEIRREVRDYGISKDAKGELSLDEKGTVYNEMVRTSEAPNALGWWGMSKLLYGDDHPLAFVSGGTPEGLRKLTPAGIRAFHAAHYQIGNMAAVAAFPSSIPLSTVLSHIGETLDAFTPPTSAPPRFMTASELPAPHGAALGTTRVVDYPYGTADHPSPAILAWPATRQLDPDERLVLESFLGAFGGGEGSALYQAFIDQKTRVVETGATGVWCWVSNDQGEPAYVWVDNVAPTHADEATVRAIRGVVASQLARIATLPDDSKELAAFGERVKARIVEARRATDKFLDTPPEFGARATSDGWISHLEDVNHSSSPRRSLTRRDAYARALAVAGETRNPWRDRIVAWGLQTEPYGEMLRASPTLRAKLDSERTARTQAELARLTASYAVSDPKEALRRRDAEIEAVSRDLAHAEASVPMPPFWSDPPMTHDDALVWKNEVVRGVPVVASTFETMKSVTAGLELRLDALPENMLPYVALLPALISNVGVVHDGVPVSYEEVRERLRREVLGVGVDFDVEFSKDRAELAADGIGQRRRRDEAGARVGARFRDPPRLAPRKPRAHSRRRRSGRDRSRQRAHQLRGGVGLPPRQGVLEAGSPDARTRGVVPHARLRRAPPVVAARERRRRHGKARGAVSFATLRRGERDRTAPRSASWRRRSRRSRPRTTERRKRLRALRRRTCPLRSRGMSRWRARSVRRTKQSSGRRAPISGHFWRRSPTLRSRPTGRPSAARWRTISSGRRPARSTR